ncbi:hypothetical protein HJC23_003999 [Cyclotella cryptica]|uniref:tRNA-guanine(15) transglycosylase-like domain-containing protein n=1 Tax=Cyclotella cryptica TaxID=29204 RepID=A0ABD3QU76_9STRA|eukprot:CCRYP_001987-RB/>CCRYP_001987-RB protein AED:0.01 eAED:0.01 QI:53/-1/1/1/-1/1/1/1636/616
MSPPAAPPPFRLLLHSRDGCIPHLTPRLIRLIFSQDDEDSSKEEWQWYRSHVILGVAVKDTCVTPLYSNKRKREDSKSDGMKKIKTADAVGKVQHCSAVEGYRDISADNKKPSGYTFLKADKAGAICQAVDSNFYPSIKGKESPLHDVSGIGNNTETKTSSYVHTYLRLPNYIQTMVVPTFSFAAQEIDEGDLNNGKKYISKRPQSQKNQPSHQERSKDKKKEQQIPNGTQKSVPIDTPHGWQCVTPEQYGDAVASLIVRGTKSANDAGAVGLFDSLDMSNYANVLIEDSSGNGSSCQPNQEAGTAAAALQKQALKKISTSFQKCTSWATSVRNCMPNSLTCMGCSMWIPVNIFSSFLPRHVLSKCFVSSHVDRKNILVESSNVAIVGYDTIPSQFHGTHRRRLLHDLISAVQSISTSESKQCAKQFLVLAVNDVKSILDAAREGVSIIGTDLARLWSCSRTASVLDLSLSLAKESIDSEVISSKSTTAVHGRIDLSQIQYANDCEPILRGCTCLTCRPRQASKRPAGYLHYEQRAEDSEAKIPSFSRAYIHHLIQAKEMLADTLLFIHNLHQMVQLVRLLSEAALLDTLKESCETDRLHSTSNLESFCQRIERQL